MTPSTPRSQPGEPVTQQLWAASADTYAAILRHPFLAGLTDGSLDRAAFRYYVIEDSHYLRGYARALALTAARAQDHADVRTFSDHAANAIAVEQALHAEFLAELGVDEDAVTASRPAPTTVAYTSYLLAVCATGSYPEALGAVLPCYWIYQRVGAQLLAGSSPDPLYARWIDTYGGEEFAAVVQAALDATDRAAAAAGPADTARMTEHFTVTARYEWMFWDAAHRQETWPI